MRTRSNSAYFRSSRLSELQTCSEGAYSQRNHQPRRLILHAPAARSVAFPTSRRAGGGEAELNRFCFAWREHGLAKAPELMRRLLTFVDGGKGHIKLRHLGTNAMAGIYDLKPLPRWAAQSNRRKRMLYPKPKGKDR